MKSRSAYPPGALNINGFSFFNAVSFQIVLGAPVILFAKSLGASSFLLGTIASLTPLLNILQLLAARFLHRTGYKRFVLAGWGARTFFTLCIAAIPVWPGLTISGRLWLLAGSLFGFNLLRGFSAGAWLPWLTALVPEQVRGSFLSRDNAFMHLGCLVALLVSAWVMSGSVEAAEYAAVFGIGLVAALISLWFVHRIPDAESPEDRLRSGVSVPWGAMLRHVPFARLLRFTTIYMTVIGSLGVFTVEYLVALAAGLLPGWPGLVGGLNFLGGLAGAVFGVANTRIVMVSVPAMGRNHFFALFTVVCGLGLGGAPMAWGAVLDALGSLEVVAGPLSINRYSLYFAVLALLACWDVRLIPGLREGVSAGSVPLAAAEARPVAPVE